MIGYLETCIGHVNFNSCGAERMNVALAMKVFRVAVPVLLFVMTMAALTLFTNLHWMICVVIAIGVGLLDVFIFAPMMEDTASKQFDE